MHDAFLRAICENPADTTPRLIYADWLDERDDQLGEFVRVQCRIAELDEQLEGVQFGCAGTHSHRGIAGSMAHGVFHATNPNVPHHHHDGRCRDPRESLRRREQELLNANWHLWLAGLPRLGWHCRNTDTRYGEHAAPYVEFRRGFVAHVTLTLADWCGGVCYECDETGSARPYCATCDGTGRVNAHGPQLAACCPLEKVTLSDRRPYLNNSGDWVWVSDRLHGADETLTLPDALFDLLVGGTLNLLKTAWYYPTEAAALDALSAAALCRARRPPRQTTQETPVLAAKADPV